MTTGFFAGREALRNVDVAHVIDVSDIGAFLGLDVGKGEHHATAVIPAGKKAFDKRLPNSEPKLREVFGKLQAKHGTVLVVVDQPASIGALPLAVARNMGCPLAYLPGLTMRRIADLYSGEAKTDARDAFVIADTARVMPHTLRSVGLQDETIAELEIITGFDDDLAGEATRISNRLRGVLTQIHPSLDRVLGPRVQHPAVLKLLGPASTNAQMPKTHSRRMPHGSRSAPIAGTTKQRTETSAETRSSGIMTAIAVRPLCSARESAPPGAGWTVLAGFATGRTVRVP